MEWIDAKHSKRQAKANVEYLVWVDEIRFDDEGEEIHGGYPQVAALKLERSIGSSAYGTHIWKEWTEGLSIDNVTHFAKIERPI